MSKNNVIQVQMDQEAYDNYINGGATGGGDSNIEYLDVSGFDAYVYGEIFVTICYQAKKTQKVQPIGLMILLGEEMNDTIAISYDPTILIDFNGNRLTPQELAFQFNENADLSIFPRITKEQFYSLETTTNTFTFSLNGSEETADNGMTWEQWVASDYNYGYYIENGNVLYNTGFGGIIQKIDGVTSSDIINVGGEYWLTDYSGGIGGLG